MTRIAGSFCIFLITIFAVGCQSSSDGRDQYVGYHKVRKPTNPLEALLQVPEAAVANALGPLNTATSGKSPRQVAEEMSDMQKENGGYGSRQYGQPRMNLRLSR